VSYENYGHLLSHTSISPPPPPPPPLLPPFLALVYTGRARACQNRHNLSTSTPKISNCLNAFCCSNWRHLFRTSIPLTPLAHSLSISPTPSLSTNFFHLCFCSSNLSSRLLFLLCLYVKHVAVPNRGRREAASQANVGATPSTDRNCPYAQI
jgi:hypothetical protein